MRMGVKVYYAEISGHKEVKKRQQRVMMILESKLIPYEAIDITEAGKEGDKDFMLKNAKPRGESKVILSPQIFNEEVYCGDYDDFDLANENDVLEDFLHTEKVERKFSLNGAYNGTGSRESSAEVEAKNGAGVVLAEESESQVQSSLTVEEPAAAAVSNQSHEPADSEVSSSTAAVTDPASSNTEHHPIREQPEEVDIDENAESHAIDKSEEKDE